MRIRRSFAVVAALMLVRGVVSCSGSDVATSSSPPLVARVVVAPTTVTLIVGASSSVTASAYDADGASITGRTVSWSATDTNVLTVGTDGAVTGVNVGESNVVATIDGVAAAAHVTVGPAVTSVSVTMEPAAIDSGRSVQAVAIGRDVGGHVVQSADFTWASSDANVATVSTTGRVTGNRPGSAEIQATWQAYAQVVSARATITVRPAPVLVASSENVVFSSVVGEAGPRPIEVVVTSGTSAAIGMTAVTAYQNGSEWLTASLAETKTPTVLTLATNPAVLAAGAYRATVTVTATDLPPKTIAVTLSVAEPSPVSAVSVGLAASAIVVGGETRAVATPRDDNGAALSGRAVTWSSSSAAVATVDNTGRVVGVAAGTASIVATSEGKSGSATITVNAGQETGAASSIAKSVGDGQTQVATRPLAIQPGVIVRNSAGQPLTGAPVNFLVTGGGGTISTNVALTGSDGVARVGWTMGPLAGPNVLSALVSGLPPVTFAATATVTLPMQVNFGSASQSVLRQRTHVSVVAGVKPSPYRAVSMTASTGGISAPMTLLADQSNVHCSPDQCWGASLDVSSLPAGNYSVTVQGVDSLGTTGSATSGQQWTKLESITTVTVALGSSTLGVNATTQATATMKDRNGAAITNATAAWRSSNTAVATVDGSGVVIARGVGTANIVAESEGVSGSASVTVSGASPPASLAQTGNGQTQVATRRLSTDPGVLVRDAAGQPLSSVAVAFAVTDGGGSITATSATTGSNGVASVGWTLGPLAGTNTLSATVSGLPPATLTATATVTLPIFVNFGRATTFIQERTHISFVAGVTSSPYRAVSVTATTGGRSAPMTISANQDNIHCSPAQCWSGIIDVTGMAAGTYTITVQGVDSLGTTGSATSGPWIKLEPIATMTVALGTSTLGVNATTQATATLKDRNGVTIPIAPINGATVAWTSSNTAVATVDANGVVVAKSSGSANIIATSEGVSANASLTVTAASPPASLTPTGNGQTQVATRRLATDPGVVVRDAAGQPLSGVPVTFAVTGGGGTVTATTVTTSSSGFASVGWTLGPTAGANSLSVSVSGLPPLTFNATATVTLPIRVEFSLATVPPRIRNSLTYRAFVRPSPYAAVSVTASTGGRSMPMSLRPNDGNPYCPPEQCWLGTFDVTGLPPGEYTVSVQAVDAVGTSGSATTTIPWIKMGPIVTATVALGGSTLAVNATTQATATMKDQNGVLVTDLPVTWTSSNPAVATVDANGLVVAKAAGFADIAATAEGVTGKVRVTVTP